MKHHILLAVLASAIFSAAFAADPELSGTIMSSSPGIMGHTASCVADNDARTYYQTSSNSYEYSRTWVGYDLGGPHVITGVKFAAASGYENYMELAIFEGANQKDFLDAIPIGMVKSVPKGETVYRINLNSSKGFRYVRVMAPANVGCTIAELRFIGHAGEGDDSKHYQITNLPTVVVNTENMSQILSKDHKVPGMVYIISDNGKSLQTQTETEVKGRGNGSWTFPKKPYRLKFNKKNSVLDASAKGKKWTLINNYGDKTLMRNKLAFDMSECMNMAYTPYCRFVDVVMNGQYEGCYQLCDQVDVRKNRVDITEMTTDDTFGPELTGGYFVEIDAYAPDETSWFRSALGQPVTIKSPDDDAIVPEQSTYIHDYFNKMESRVMNSYSTDADGGYTDILDLDSYIKFIMINELAGNSDLLWSVFMYKDRNEPHFFTGPVWDFDLAFENDVRVYPVLGMEDYMFTYRVNMASPATGQMACHIMKEDKGAIERISRLWSEARILNGLTYENFCDKIDRYAAELKESQDLNFRRWPILDTKVHQNPMALGAYEPEVERVKEYLRDRFDALDERFGLDITLGVGSVSGDAENRVSLGYYDMLGRKIERPLSGFCIERFSDGTSIKRFVSPQ